MHFIIPNVTSAMHIVLTIQATDSCQRSGHDHRLGARSGKDEKGNEGFHATQQTLFSCKVKFATGLSRSARCTAAADIAMLLTELSEMRGIYIYTEREEKQCHIHQKQLSQIDER